MYKSILLFELLGHFEVQLGQNVFHFFLQFHYRGVKQRLLSFALNVKKVEKVNSQHNLNNMAQDF